LKFRRCVQKLGDYCVAYGRVEKSRRGTTTQEAMANEDHYHPVESL